MTTLKRENADSREVEIVNPKYQPSKTELE